MNYDDKINSKQEILCYHCGDLCKDKSIHIDDKYFCCQSCKLVYEILEQNNLCKYYDIDSNPGITPAVRSEIKYEYLDDDATKQQMLDFSATEISALQLSSYLRCIAVPVYGCLKIFINLTAE